MTGQQARVPFTTFSTEPSETSLPVLWLALFWSPQIRKEVKMFDWSYCTQQNLEIVRQKLCETLCKMFSCDNNIKPAVYLVLLLYTIPTVFHHLNPTGRIVCLVFLATLKPSLKLNKTFSNYQIQAPSPRYFSHSHRIDALTPWFKISIVSISSRWIFGQRLSSFHRKIWIQNDILIQSFCDSTSN